MLLPCFPRSPPLPHRLPQAPVGLNLLGLVYKAAHSATYVPLCGDPRRTNAPDVSGFFLYFHVFEFFALCILSTFYLTFLNLVLKPDAKNIPSSLE